MLRGEEDLGGTRLQATSVRPIPTSPLRGGEFLHGAHHPHCDRYRHHLVWFGSRPLCLGCTCITAGLPLGVALAALSGAEGFSAPGALVLAGLILPTALQPFIQHKPFKLAARTCAGVFSGAYGVMCGALAVESSWFLLAAAIVLFAGSARGLLWLRARFPDNPCRSCPLGVYPTCSWNMDRLLRNADPLLRAALASGKVEVSERYP